MNPFLLKGYKGNQYFCNRKKETESLITAIRNSQDITLYSYRRLGKSALIHHTFHQLKNDFICIYADIWGTSNVDEFIRELTNGILASSLFSKQKLSVKMAGFLKSIGASFSIDSDGSPSVNVIYNDKSESFRSIEEIFKFLNHSEKQIIFAIDEFQEIKKYDQKIPLEGKLRALVQQSDNIVFLYSGSEKHLLNKIFNEYNKPFYQTTRMFSIDKIESDSYKNFIIHHFTKKKRNINPEIIDYILNISHLHTYYVQAISNFLYSQKKLPKSISEFELIYKEFILEKSVFYSELPNILSKQQFMVVKGVAKSKLVSTPTSADFMTVANIRSASTMARAVNSLLEKQILIKDNGSLRLYDVFLEHYLRYILK